MKNIRYILISSIFVMSLLLVMIVQWELMEFEQISSGVDPSWIAVLGEANTRGWRFGQDIIFTGGPLNFVYTHYYLKSHIAIYVICSLLFIATLLIMWTEFVVENKFSFVAVALVFLLCFGWGVRDYLFLSLPLSCVYFFVRLPSGARFKMYYGLGVLSSALATLAKFTVFPMSVLIFLLNDLLFVKERRFPVSTILYMSFLYIAFIATSATGSDFLLYIIGSWKLSSAYTMAMSAEYASRRENIDYVLFILVISPIIAFLCIRSLKVGDKSSHVQRAVVCVTVFAFTWVCFKQGFVRHSSGRSASTLIGGCFAGMLLLMTSKPLYLSRVQQGVLIAVFSIVTLYTVYIKINNTAGGEVAFGERAMKIADRFSQISEVARFMSDPDGYISNLEIKRKSRLADVSSDGPVSSLPGSVDIIDSRQSSLIAAGVRYVPRPTIQEYATYSADLIGLNAEFYNSDKAPDFVLIKPGSIDDRLPASVEGSLWPVLFANYFPSNISNNDLILQRRRVVIANILRKKTVKAYMWGQSISLDRSVLFVSAKIKPSFVGAVAALIYKIPSVYLACYVDDGSSVVYRIVPEQALAGFFLNPVVNTAEELHALASGKLPRQPIFLNSCKLRSLASSLFFESKIDVTIQELDLERLASGSP